MSQTKADKELVPLLLKDETLINLIYQDVLRLADKYKFNSLEIPKNMMLLNTPFSVPDDTLTPT